MTDYDGMEDFGFVNDDVSDETEYGNYVYDDYEDYDNYGSYKDNEQEKYENKNDGVVNQSKDNYIGVQNYAKAKGIGVHMSKPARIIGQTIITTEVNSSLNKFNTISVNKLEKSTSVKSLNESKKSTSLTNQNSQTASTSIKNVSIDKIIPTSIKIPSKVNDNKSTVIANTIISDKLPSITTTDKSPSITIMKSKATDNQLKITASFRLVLKQSRARSGMTQEDLAYEIGESVELVQHYENGTIIPDRKIVNKFNDVLGITLPEIDMNERRRKLETWYTGITY